jgi:hypothetical protein
MESLELFAREVMPEFKDRDQKIALQKKQRLQPAVDAAMARHVDDAPPLPEGYTITPMFRKMIEKQVGKEAIEKFADAQAAGTMPGVMQMAAERQRRPS